MTRPEDQPRGGAGQGGERWYRPQLPEDFAWAPPGSEPAEGAPEQPDAGQRHEFEQDPAMPPHGAGSPRQQGGRPWPPPEQPYAQFPPPGEGYQPGPPPSEDHTHLSFPEPEPPQRFVIGPGYQNPGFQNQGFPDQGFPDQGPQNQGFPDPGFQNQGPQNPGFQDQGYPQPPRPVLPGPDPMQPPGSAHHPASAPYHQDSAPYHPDSAPYHPDSAPYHPGSAAYPPQEPVPPHPMSYGSAAPQLPYSQASAPLPHNQPSATYPPQADQPAQQWPPAPAAQQPSSKRNNHRAIAALVIGAVALAGVLLFGISQFQRASQSTATGTSAAKELSRPAPPGWSKRFIWSTDIPATAAVAVVENRVAYIDAAGSLHVLNADTGQPVLTSTTNTLTKDAKPFLAVTQGVPVAGIIDGTTLLLWRLDTPQGEPRTITLATKGKLYAQGGGLLITTGSEYWVVNAAGALSPVTLPPDHVALAATPDGNLLSSPPRGGWTINSANPGTAPREVQPERTPDGTVGEIQVAWSSRGVIAAWGDTADPARRTVGLYDADTGKLLAQGTLGAEVVKAGLPLTVSPKREFASAGPLLARLSDGKTEVVDRWSTIMSDSKNLYGSRDGQKMFWNGELQPMTMDPKAVVPWGMSDARYAVVMDPLDATRVRLGALAEG